MKVIVTSHFNRDISKLHDKRLIQSVKATLQKLESVKALLEIPHLKKMVGTKQYFRIRIGEYRMGIFFENETLHVSRFLHRKEIYRYFP